MGDDLDIVDFVVEGIFSCFSVVVGLLIFLLNDFFIVCCVDFEEWKDCGDWRG